MSKWSKIFVACLIVWNVLLTASGGLSWLLLAQHAYLHELALELNMEVVEAIKEIEKELYPKDRPERPRFRGPKRPAISPPGRT